MPSTLAWLDHDVSARDRTERILALFEERDTVDELGLGAIRDAFSDRLFPGTSTIQTRLRYFLFIPWIYRRLEEQEVPSHRAAEEGRKLEHRLSLNLLKADDTDGVFGKQAGRRLKRLASQVYWGGLGSWGIRTFDGSRSRHHAALDAIYRRRRELANRSPEDPEAVPERLRTWHPGLPDSPPGFPEAEGLTLELTADEATYLQDRVQTAHPKSLLAFLFLHAEPAEAEFPWEYPIRADLGDRNREVLHHARLFSLAAEGATLLYNLLLARKAGWEEKVEEHGERFRRWEEELDRAELGAWSLERLWELTEGQGHTITTGARRFVERWVRLCVASGSLREDDDAAELVRRRERRVKGVRSRFENREALDRWGGRSGLGRFSYRWNEVKTYLADLHTGLETV